MLLQVRMTTIAKTTRGILQHANVDTGTYDNKDDQRKSPGLRLIIQVRMMTPTKTTRGNLQAYNVNTGTYDNANKANNIRSVAIIVIMIASITKNGIMKITRSPNKKRKLTLFRRSIFS